MTSGGSTYYRSVGPLLGQLNHHTPPTPVGFVRWSPPRRQPAGGVEEFLAGAYERDGYEVVITPRSSDKGRDVIATKSGFGSIRILDQAKAYSPGKSVTQDDVRAMLGVLATDSNASKGVITTTSDFQPGILSGDDFKRFMPYRLELKNGQQLRDWLKQLKSPAT